MTSEANPVDGRSRPLRWLIVPTVAGVLIAATTAVLRRRARKKVAVEPVSDAWLREHEFDTGRRSEY